jgi:hypothetical protein
VVGARRPFTGDVAPAGLDGDHQCGTKEDFEQGGKYLPDDPPAEYDANGFLKCCHGPKKLRGGAGAGGKAGRPRGFTDATDGGMAVGGECGDVLFGTPVPGPSCATAGVVPIDYTFGASTHPFGLIQDWWQLPAYVAGATYRVQKTGFPGLSGSLLLRLYYGPCSGLTEVTYSHNTTTCVDFVAPDSGPLYLLVSTFSIPPEAYTLNINQNPC